MSTPSAILAVIPVALALYMSAAAKVREAGGAPSGVLGHGLPGANRGRP